jgi:hypothetical protein
LLRIKPLAAEPLQEFMRPWDSENNKLGTIADRGTRHDLESKASDSCRTREFLRSRHFHNAVPAEQSDAASPDQLPPATARPSDAFPNRRFGDTCVGACGDCRSSVEQRNAICGFRLPAPAAHYLRMMTATKATIPTAISHAESD